MVFPCFFHAWVQQNIPSGSPLGELLTEKIFWSNCLKKIKYLSTDISQAKYSYCINILTFETIWICPSKFIFASKTEEREGDKKPAEWLGWQKKEREKKKKKPPSLNPCAFLLSISVRQKWQSERPVPNYFSMFYF